MEVIAKASEGTFASVSPMDQVEHLLRLQRADGSWERTYALSDWLTERTTAQRPADVSVDAWMTAFVIHFFRSRLADAQAAWAESVDRAVTYIATACTTPVEFLRDVSEQTSFSGMHPVA